MHMARTLYIFCLRIPPQFLPSKLPLRLPSPCAVWPVVQLQVAERPWSHVTHQVLHVDVFSLLYVSFQLQYDQSASPNPQNVQKVPSALLLQKLGVKV